jgi:predicted nucleotidyltransferase
VRTRQLYANLEEARLPANNFPDWIKEWTPRDGDAILTKEGFIFYVIGYLHPPERVISYVKYVPKKLAEDFDIKWLPYEWKLEDSVLVRPAMLYSPSNYDRILSVFKQNHPEYVVEDKNLRKELLTVPKTSIKSIFEPSARLMRLLEKQKKGHLDELEKAAAELIVSISGRSRVPLSRFGIHGSISLGMHNSQSDIDVAVYGAGNFREVLLNMNEMVQEDMDLGLLEESIYDTLRKNRFIWNSRRVVVNAIRMYEEINERFGDFNYISAGQHLSFTCEVNNDWESVFRPAIYGIANYKELDPQSRIERSKQPTQSVSMIGELRGIASTGDKIKVSGSLERVEDAKTGELHHYRAVVGSAELKPQDEFITVIEHHHPRNDFSPR